MSARKAKIFIVLLMITLCSCATRSKIARLGRSCPCATLALSENKDLPTMSLDTARNDTLVIKNIEGNDVIVMKAIRDDDGEMVAHQVLTASYVTATFRNVAERRGKVDIAFQIIVPALLRDSNWQIRYYPKMHILGDTLTLDKLLITGENYRKRQLRGYQQYQRFLDSIISDTTKFIRQGQLEIFISRNIPALYAFRTDSSYVSDEQFHSVFGVGEREAIEHYTNKFIKNINDRRKAKRDMKFRRYVKAPILSSGIRLDTIIVNDNGDYVYNYVQTITTRPRLRKVEVVLSGEIYEQSDLVFRIPAGEPLTFFISSLSTLIDSSPRYLTRIVERKAQADCSYNIDFRSGSSALDEHYGDNLRQIRFVREQLRAVLQNEKFDLDSIVVAASASPEGKFTFNDRLARQRSRSMSSFVCGFIKMFRDSTAREAGVRMNMDGTIVREKKSDSDEIRVLSRSIGEDWHYLDILVQEDSLLSCLSKDRYEAIRAAVSAPDKREEEMKKEKWYLDVRQRLYPQLRRVKFQFHMHRKGMIQDTLMTTVLDSLYMSGVQAIKDRDYEEAVRILGPYEDFNTAVAYCALDRNASAEAILRHLPQTAQKCYIMAIIHSRRGDERSAVESYMLSCSMDRQFVHRGNLDPEISQLIRKYGLNRDDDIIQ